MAQPFALENLASKVGLSQKRAQQGYFNTRAKEATDLLEKELDKMQKRASEKGGFFGKAFGKHSGIAKILASIALNAIPGIGQVASFALNAADLAKSQSDMKKNIKNLGKDKAIPARFQGTFLEDYLKGGMMSAQEGLKLGLEGSKDMQLLLGLASLVPGAVSAGKALPQAGQQLGLSGPGGLFSKAAKLPTSMIGPNAIAPLQGPDMVSTGLAQPTSLQPNILDKIAGFAKKGEQIGVPYTDWLTKGEGGLNIGLLLKPIMGTDIKNKALQSVATQALTPANYSFLLQDLLQNYLTKPGGEPTMTEARAPKLY